MERAEAINILAQHELPALSGQERDDMLYAHWFSYQFEPDDAGKFPQDLPDDLRNELLKWEQCYPAESPRYDSLLVEALAWEYTGVRNEYLAKRLVSLGLKDVMVSGDSPPRFRCPCCGYHSLDERGQYDICSVCFWEDSGDDDSERYSGSNHMTLGEGQDNFAKYGACITNTVKSLKADRFERYERS